MVIEESKVEAIFFAALEKQSPEDCVAYLDEACAEDASLRLRIEALLNAQPKLANFLQGHASEMVAMTLVPHSAERPGTQIGPYKLLQQIGEGGMGVVYMAEQSEPVKRKLALKLIKPGMDSHQVIARFEAERQALSMMDHVNIARVLDAGATESGRPYFVMELINGVPITKYCDDNHLTPRQRLELFVPVCQAIQHAHQKGVIHRDIKPSNVMITLYDGKPVPKVIDFGVAKATEQKLTERTLFTQYGTLVGTLEYMSPEQAEMSSLGVDTRSDIYSLGVLLYELLTGSTPLSHKTMKEAAYGEILRLIKEEEPPRPSTRLSESGEALASISAQRHTEPAKLSKLMRGELDWIVMKTLEKDRNRRYETANGFASDVQRYLNDEPVQACPPSMWYRFSKLARRNRFVFTTAILVAAVLVLGTVVSAWQAIRAEAARTAEAEQRQIAEVQQKAAETERAAAEKQRELAEANFEMARKAVDEYFTLVSESTLFDVPGLQPLRKGLLEAALRFYEKTAVERNDDPAVLADLAVTYIRVAVINYNVDRNDDAVAAAGQALKVIDRLRSEFPDNREPLRRLGGFWKGFRPTQEATELPKNLEVAVDTITRLIEAWEDLVAQFPVDAAFRSDLSALYLLTGDLLASAGKPADGVRYFAKGEALLVQLMRDVPDHPEYRADLARIHEQLARNLPRAGRAQDAEAESRAGLALREQLVAEFPESPQYRAELVVSLRQYMPYEQKRDPGEAGRLARRAKDLAESLTRDYPNVPLYRDFAGSKPAWLRSQVSTGRKENIDEALLILDGWVANRPADPAGRAALAFGVRHIAEALRKKDEYVGKSTELHRLAFQMFEHLANEFPDNPSYREHVGHSRRYLGWIARDAGRTDEAIDHFGAGVAAFEKRVDANHPNDAPDSDFLADTLKELGLVLAASGKVPEAENAHRRAVEAYELLLRDHPESGDYQKKAASAARLLTVLLLRQQKLPAALAEAQKAAKLAPNGFYDHQLLLDVLTRIGNTEQTMSILRDNVAAMPDSPMAHHHLGVALERRGQIEDAIAEFEITSQLRPDWEWPHLCMATNFAILGNWDKASAEYSNTFEIDPGSWWKIVDSLSVSARTADRDRVLRQLISVADGRAEDTQFRISRGALHRELSEMDEAIADFSWVIAKEPERAEAWDFRGNCYLRKGEFERAAEDSSNAIKLNPADWKTWYSRGSIYTKNGQHEKAASDFAEAIELCSKNAGALNDLAWRFATSPDADLRNGSQAVELARKGIELASASVVLPNTLGVSHYRNGNWPEAIKWLEKSMELRDGGDSFDWIFLAMANWQLDNKDEARKWYAKAVEWMDANKPKNQELLRFRAEAEELMKKETADQ